MHVTRNEMALHAVLPLLAAAHHRQSNAQHIALVVTRVFVGFTH